MLCTGFGLYRQKKLLALARMQNDFLISRPSTMTLYFLYHILVILVCLIFFCSWKMPYISASAVGGHPGT